MSVFLRCMSTFNSPIESEIKIDVLAESISLWNLGMLMLNLCANLKVSFSGAV